MTHSSDSRARRGATILARLEAKNDHANRRLAAATEAVGIPMDVLARIPQLGLLRGRDLRPARRAIAAHLDSLPDDWEQITRPSAGELSQRHRGRLLRA